MACLVNAFGCVDEAYISAATELAETVTFYLYNQHNDNTISSGEIFSIIQAVLSSTGYGFAAENLSNHNQKRNLLRTRIEITKINTKSDSFQFSGETDIWNKSKIVRKLQVERELDVATARTIASIVEEKVINSGIRNFTTEFIKFLVISQTQAIISAQQQLKISARAEKYIFENEIATDGHLRQPQKGLCPVGV
jgi:hypothetical protein